jgi:glucose uptake protein
MKNNKGQLPHTYVNIKSKKPPKIHYNEVKQKLSTTLPFETSIILSLTSAILWGTDYNPLRHCKKFGNIEFSNSLILGGILTGWVAFLTVDGARLSEVFSENLLSILIPFFGGIIWAVANFFALLAVRSIGIARGFTIWNFCGAIAFAWGVFFFGEIGVGSLFWILAISGIIIMLLGSTISAMSTRSSDKEKEQLKLVGVVSALFAAVGFGTFMGFIVPLSFQYGADAWLVCAISPTGGMVFYLIYSFAAGKISGWVEGPTRDHLLGVMGGLLWNAGNICNFLAIRSLGVSIAFPIGLLNTIVANGWGILYYKELSGAPKKYMYYAIVGATLLIFGATILGYSKFIFGSK